MLFLTSVTVCAMALVFAVVSCQGRVLDCPNGTPTSCVIPWNDCPSGSNATGLCPHKCCYMQSSKLGQIVCECKAEQFLANNHCQDGVPKACKECCEIQENSMFGYSNEEAGG